MLQGVASAREGETPPPPPDQAFSRHRLALGDEVVPADVRHGQALAGVKVLDGAWDDAQALAAAVLLRTIKQQLHAQADAQERPVSLQGK